jgi:hypothetical protein
MSHPYYELASNVSCILNLIFLAFDPSYDNFSNKKYDNRWDVYGWEYFQISINVIYLIEFGFQVSAGGSKAFKTYFRLWPEMICQLMSFWVMIEFLNNIWDD